MGTDPDQVGTQHGDGIAGADDSGPITIQASVQAAGIRRRERRR
jgi:hypothetical protein